MTTKQKRQALISQLIQQYEITTQEQLLSLLAEKGMEPTQATLSRDLREMQVSRMAKNGLGMVYTLPEATATPTTFLLDGIIALSFSGNMAVIKTQPGYAGGIASWIDQGDLPEIVGTVAGDDTILIIMKEGITPQQFILSMEVLIPDIQSFYFST